jgi:hypothetical protein
LSIFGESHGWRGFQRFFSPEDAQISRARENLSIFGRKKPLKPAWRLASAEDAQGLKI